MCHSLTNGQLGVEHFTVLIFAHCPDVCLRGFIIIQLGAGFERQSDQELYGMETISKSICYATLQREEFLLQ